MEFEELYNKLIDNDFFTQEELDLVLDVKGQSIETLNACIYHRYGYNNYEQLTDYEQLEGEYNV